MRISRRSLIREKGPARGPAPTQTADFLDLLPVIVVLKDLKFRIIPNNGNVGAGPRAGPVCKLPVMLIN